MVNVKSYLREHSGNEYTYKPKIYNDGKILQKNPRPDRFPECQFVTNNLVDKVNQIELLRNSKRLFEYAPRELWGNLMLYGAELKRKNPNKKILIAEPTEEGLVIWFVKNETGGYTAMLPSDW
jgi:hypothetical protein